MFKTWLKKKLPNHTTIEKMTTLSGLKGLQQQALWRFDCQSVARGLAVGLFAAILPVPMQMLLAAVLAILVRGNLPIALAATWISNPLTFLPITYFIYFIGKCISGGNSSKVVLHQFNWEFSNLDTFWASFSKWISQFGSAFFIGLPIVAIGAGVLGYFAVIVFWKTRSYFQKGKQKK